MGKQKIKVAFIGAGYMTTEHMKAFADHEDVIIAGIYSKTHEKCITLRNIYPGLLVCSSIEDLYTQTNADLVVVSVSELAVHDIAVECLRYPWMSMFEKPLGLDLAEAISISEQAIHRHRKVFVAFNRRHYNSTRKVIDDLKNIDGQRIIHIQDQEDILVQRKKGVDELLLRNWMYANSIHIIDYFTFLGRGKITGVEIIKPFDFENPGYTLCTIAYDSGDIGVYEAIWNAPAPWTASVTTPLKRWELRPLETAAYQEYGSRKQNTVVPHEWDTHFKPGLRLQAEEAIKAVKGLDHELPDLEASLRTMKLIASIYPAQAILK